MGVRCDEGMLSDGFTGTENVFLRIMQSMGRLVAGWGFRRQVSEHWP